MSEQNQVVTQSKTVPYTATTGYYLLIILVVKIYSPPEMVESYMLLAPVIAPILAYFTNMFIAQNFNTPEEIFLKRKLKEDKKHIEDILDEANRYPHRYIDQELYLSELRKDLQETNLQLARVGRTLIAKKFN